MRHRQAFVAELRGDHQTAADLYASSIELVRDLAVHEVIAGRLAHLARVLELGGDGARAAELLAEADALLRWLAGSDSRGPMSRRRSDLHLARGDLNDTLVWYEAAGDGSGAAFVRDRLGFLEALME